MKGVTTMQNEMRDRLVELIDDYIHYVDVKEWYSEELDEGLADYLIEEGVIVPPCKVGESCYPLPRYKTPIVKRKISRITFSKRNIIIGYYENDGQYRPPLRTRVLGEDVFLTKEEAEKALKEGVDNG